MRTGFFVTVNDRDLIKKLNRASDNVQKVIQDFLVEEALAWQKSVRKKLTENKSVVTGDLRRSITVQKKSKWEYLVGTNLHYAPYVEYGTRRAGAKPYFEPVYDSRSTKFKSELEALLRKAVGV